MKERIEPCHRCGPKRSKATLSNTMHRDLKFFVVQCKCGARGLSMMGKRLALESWNARQKDKK